MAAAAYNRGKFIFIDSSLNLVSDTIRALLVTSAYTFDPDHNFVSDITNEVAHASYARQDMSNKSVAEDDANDRAEYHADPVDFGALTGVTPDAIIIYKFVTNDAASPLIGYSDVGFGAVANGAGYVVDVADYWLALATC